MFKFSTSPNTESNPTTKELLDALSRDIKTQAQSTTLFERRTISIPLGGIAVPFTKIGEK